MAKKAKTAIRTNETSEQPVKICFERIIPDDVQKAAAIIAAAVMQVSRSDGGRSRVKRCRIAQPKPVAAATSRRRNEPSITRR